MLAYCMHELHFSRAAALKRIDAGRAARQFEAILEAVADGRLHLSGVVLLAPRLTRENADELLAAATHKTREEIEQLIAERRWMRTSASWRSRSSAPRAGHGRAGAGPPQTRGTSRRASGTPFGSAMAASAASWARPAIAVRSRSGCASP
jgi:hypothetical protein